MSVTKTQIDGYFKEEYGEVERAVPEFADFQKDIPFETRKRVGDTYNFPVFLRRSHGVTWAGTGTAAGSLYTLNDPVSLLSKNASVSGTEMTLQEDVAYGVLTRAQEEGPAAFGDAMDEVTTGILDSMRFYLEMNIIYGGGNIGVVAGRSDDSGTTQTFQLTAQSWAPGLWSGMEGAFCDVYSSGGSKRNSSGTLEVDVVDPDSCTVTFIGTEAEMDNIIATDVIVPRGASTNWFSGLDTIITNTGSLFGINAADYHLWKGNTRSAGSQKLVLSKVLSAVSKGVVRGLREAVCVKLNTFAWDDLNNDLSALRRFAEKTRTEMDQGTLSIKFYGSNGGEISLEPHAMVKAGDAFLFPKKRVKRVGSTDVTLRLPGVKGQEDAMYQELETKNGIRLRGFSDQAIIVTQPAKCTKITAITPASLEYTTLSYV